MFVSQFVLLILFSVMAVAAQQPTITLTIGGTVYQNTATTSVPAPGVTVFLTIRDGVADSVDHMQVVTNGAGYYSVTRTFLCNPSTAGVGLSGVILRDDGSLAGGSGGQITESCVEPPDDYSHTFGIGFSGTAGQFNPQDAGPTCHGLGKPVNPVNGNMYVEQTDYNLPGIGDAISVKRTYNSMIQASGIFGVGWKSDYDETITRFGNYIRLNMGSGQALYFAEMEARVFYPVNHDLQAHVVWNYPDGTFTLYFKDGRIHKFNTFGQLLWQKDRNGNQTTLNYNQIRILTGITDASGRTLTVTPNTNGTVSQISDSMGIVASYEYYPTTVFLKTVTYADGSKYKFEYVTINNKNYLATVRDALDNILETHAYDSQGRATTSEVQGGVEKYTLDYANAGLTTNPYTTVTDALGHVTKYYFDKSRGRSVVTKTEGVCGGCGGSGS
ncbi:MAG: RHS repeat protein, partial [Saprospiraceae bacterium]|nr:RHS repeat protein [Pyrinomonadaceae bacterium]